MTATRRERFLLKYTGKQILGPGHQEHSQGRAFCVLVTEEQKGVCASLSRGDGRLSVTGPGVVAGTVCGLPSFPGSIIPSPTPQSLLGVIIRQRRGTRQPQKMSL